MKFIFFINFFCLLTIFSCKNEIHISTFGEFNTITDLENFSNVIDKISLENIDNKNLSGKIINVCPKKGCWMNLKVDEDTIFVKFKDYGFFVPKTGVETNFAFISGNISKDTISVERLRHYAEDAGKSSDEIEKIIAPQLRLSFLADGVAIKIN
tara:strand:+ start:2328 stop:2789 length:462 start_codon:yes stop_codon:yes gene_type:complete